MLLSLAYFPPISYFALIAKEFTLSADEVIPSLVHIDSCEGYQKQSWRNRFRFYASEGPQDLNFPIVHKDSHGVPVSKVRVDYSTPWVVKTERALASAYESSPFFEHYADGIFAFLDSHPETVLDLDLGLTRLILDKVGIRADIRLTDRFVHPRSSSEPDGSDIYGEDYRELIHPKRPDTILRDLGLERPYWQVFASKHGFVPNLSILDLLFNEGPDSILYLK
ncbi:MAG: WbqC family protein [Bacteroidales bacterium]|nr:WbqC family protein [Bacteroidales bacterium]